MSRQRTATTEASRQHHHKHRQNHGSHHTEANGQQGGVLTIRAHSGLSGDMLLAGLLRITDTGAEDTNQLTAAILPDLAGTVSLVRRQVNNIGGWHAEVSLPPQHEHRTLADIRTIIAASDLADEAKRLATDTFTLLAKAESTVHDKNQEEVHFHEVGALDSILDICMVCELFTRLAPALFVVSPLPLADGRIKCAHGILPLPAPAVLEMLEGIPVRPFPGSSETVTPTAIALLRSLGAQFGPWPSMYVERQTLVYGSTIFPDAPNGAIFAWGTIL